MEKGNFERDGCYLRVSYPCHSSAVYVQYSTQYTVEYCTVVSSLSGRQEGVIEFFSERFLAGSKEDPSRATSTL